MRIAAPRGSMNLWIDTAGAARAEPLFGLQPLERLRRSIGRAVAGDATILSGPGASANTWPGARIDADDAPLGSRLRRALATCTGMLVAIVGATTVDPRLIRFLAAAPRSCVASRGDGDCRAVAMALESTVADAIPADAVTLAAVTDSLLASGRIERLDERTFPAYIDKLRRSLPFWLYTVRDATMRRAIERRMFLENYKGSTDLLTRWVYPPVVWQLVRLCTRFGVHPNVVTILSIILAFAAVPLFATGHFLSGFVCAYAMSVLDSVDGKVARLMLTDSPLGNALDHGLDQVHPPFWYFAWAWGLGAHSVADPLFSAAIWLIGFYFADRLVLMLARKRLGFALHAATKLDGSVRSIIARRNITMTIVAVALLLGHGRAGFLVVTAWQGLTFAWHAARTAWLGYVVRDRLRPES